MIDALSLPVKILYIIGTVVGLVVVGGAIASTVIPTTPTRDEEDFVATKTQEEKSTSSGVHTQSGSEMTHPEEIKPLPIRKLLSREELMAAEWPIAWNALVDSEWRRFGEYEIRFIGGLPKAITVRKAEPPQDVVSKFTTEIFVPSLPNVSVVERQEGVAGTDILVSENTGKLYFFITFGNSHVGWLGKVYESDIFGKHPKELGEETGWRTGGVKDFRLSADRTTLSYVADETDGRLNERTGIVEQVGDERIVFYVIDLLNTENSIQLVLPHGEERLGLVKGDYWVTAWQYAEEEGVFEFTLYRRDRILKRTSAKELWRYDKKKSELTLIETIAHPDEE